MLLLHDFPELPDADHVTLIAGWGTLSSQPEEAEQGIWEQDHSAPTETLPPGTPHVWTQQSGTLHV